MTGDPDEDALRWEGDPEPSYTPPASERSPEQPQPASPPSPAGEPARTTSFLLVTYGILAGAYLIYTIGWLAPVLSSPRLPSTDVLGEFMVRLSQVLAIASPAIWFGATMLLTRDSRPLTRLLLLIAGLVVLLPWPYLLLGV